MTESDFKREYLFVLGNGASIASVNPQVKDILKNLSIEEFVSVLEEIDKNKNNTNFYKHFDCNSDSYIPSIQRIIKISQDKKTKNIVRLLAYLKEDEFLLDQEMAEVNLYDNEIALSAYIEKRLPILDDIRKLICVIFITISSYYKKFENNYFLKLWRIVQSTQSPVVSLNWDINFEKVIHEDTKNVKEIPMKNYYGYCAFKQLFLDETISSHNPIVNILKPHGSLNWHFIDRLGMQGRIVGNLNESDYHLVVSDHDSGGHYVGYDLWNLSFLIPPLPEKEIPLINESSPHCSLDPFWRRKKAIKDDIFIRIKEYAASTRMLIIIGYSFPDDDEHIKELFKDNRFENVWVFDKSEETFARIDNEKCFQNAKRKFFKGGFADIMDWIPGDVGEGFKPSRSQ